jgi:ribokinase
VNRVVVVGDLVTDVIVRTREPIQRGTDTTADVRLTGGGAAANTACWLAHCGVDTALVARVGGDELGRARTLELLGAGVEALVKVDHDAVTGAVVVLVDAAGERSMLADRGASLNLSPDDLDRRLFEPTAHLHLSGYVLFEPGPLAAGLHALAAARSARMTVSVDAASAAPLAAVGADAFLSWTAPADLLLANADEAEVLTGNRDPHVAARYLARFYGVAVVKAGAAGAVWANGDAVYECPARTTNIVDTIGAGDAFAAGLLAEWLRPGSTPESALGAGARLAAHAVSNLGGRPIDR